MFKDRIEAGLMLSAKLMKYKADPGIVLAVPKGGVPLAYIVAKELGFPLEVIFTKKIGHPSNKEYAIGAASLTDYFIIPHKEVSKEYIDGELQNIRKKLKEMYRKFMGDQHPENLEGKTVIVIDDGMATGNTILATVNVIEKSKPGKIVIGVPVSSQSAVRNLSREVDEVVALLTPADFSGVGAYYENFSDVSEEEVLLYLNKLKGLNMVH